jgi:hypothetical protein
MVRMTTVSVTSETLLALKELQLHHQRQYGGLKLSLSELIDSLIADREDFDFDFLNRNES